MRAEHELVQRELEVERTELADEPEAERRELAALYLAAGPPSGRRDGCRILSANDNLALDTHARLELGIDPDAAGSARQARAVSFLAFGSARCCRSCPGFSVVAPPGDRLDRHRPRRRSARRVHRALTGRGVLRTALRQLAAVLVAAG